MGHTSTTAPELLHDSPLDWYGSDDNYLATTEGGTELAIRRGPKGWTVSAYKGAIGDLRLDFAETLQDALNMAHDFGFEMDEAGEKLAAERVMEALRNRLITAAERFTKSVRAHTPRDMTTDLDIYLQDLQRWAEEYIKACEQTRGIA